MCKREREKYKYSKDMMLLFNKFNHNIEYHMKPWSKGEIKRTKSLHSSRSQQSQSGSSCSIKSLATVIWKVQNVIYKIKVILKSNIYNTKGKSTLH